MALRIYQRGLQNDVDEREALEKLLNQHEHYQAVGLFIDVKSRDYSGLSSKIGRSMVCLTASRH